MGTLKWITGMLGWVAGGPIGALLGIFFGSLVEQGLEAINLLGSGTDDAGQQSQTYQRTYRIILTKWHHSALRCRRLPRRNSGRFRKHTRPSRNREDHSLVKNVLAGVQR